jgi:hypothetical protein
MHLFCLTLITVAKFGTPLVPHFLIVSRNLQNRAAKAIVGRKNEHGQSELALNELNWKPLSERRAQSVARFMYKITPDLAPLPLTDIFQKTSSSQHYNLRGFSAKLHLPKPKTEYLKKSLSYKRAKLWNSLPDELSGKEYLTIYLTKTYDTWLLRVPKSIITFTYYLIY